MQNHHINGDADNVEETGNYELNFKIVKSILSSAYSTSIKSRQYLCYIYYKKA